jgi:hypothetical protein
MHAFLKKLDHRLLTNNPSVWSARNIWVLFYCFIFSAVLGLLCLLLLPDPRKDTTMAAVITGFVVVACVIGFIIWLIYLLRFNVFKRFGTKSKYDFLRQLLLLFLSCLFIILPAFLPFYVQTKYTNYKYPETALIADINFIKENIYKLEANTLIKQVDTTYHLALPQKNQPTAIANENETKGEIVQPTEDIVTQGVVAAQAEDIPYGFYEPNAATKKLLPKNKNYTIYTAAALQEDIRLRRENYRRINDSLYYSISVPTNEYMRLFSLPNSVEKKIIADSTLVRLYANNANIFKDSVAIQKQILEKVSKYSLTANNNQFKNVRYRVLNYNDVVEEATLEQKYYLNYANDGLQNIFEKKYFFTNLNEEFGLIRLIFYIAFSISLLLFIFRHTTIKSFFLTLLTVVILLIINAIILAVIRAEETAVFTFVFFYYLLFGVLALTIFNAKTQKTVHGIALNIFTYFLPMLPLLIAFCCYSLVNNRYSKYGYQRLDNNFVEPAFVRNFLKIIPFVEVGQIILFLLIAHFVLRTLYKRWYALPTD